MINIGPRNDLIGPPYDLDICALGLDLVSDFTVRGTVDGGRLRQTQSDSARAAEPTRGHGGRVERRRPGQRA